MSERQLPQAVPKAFFPKEPIGFSGFARSKQSIPGLNSSTVYNPYDTIVIPYPEVVGDNDTFDVAGDLTVSDSTASKYAACVAVEDLIEGCWLDIGGQTLGPQSFYNQIWRLWQDYQRTYANLPWKQILSLSYDGSTTDPSASASSQGACVNGKFSFRISGFLGLISTMRVMYANRMPPIKLMIKLASPAVLVAASGDTGGTYSITNVSATVDRLDIPAGVQQIFDQQLASEGGIEVAIPNYQMWVNTGLNSLNQLSNWSSSSRSVEMVVGTFLSKTYNVLGQNTFDAVTGRSKYFTRGSTGLASTTTGQVTSQFNVNGTPYPLVPADFAKKLPLSHTMQSFGENRDFLSTPNPNFNSFPNYCAKFFAHAQNFTWNDTESFYRKGGLNGAGNVIRGSWQTFTSGTDDTTVTPALMLFTKASLLMSSGNSAIILY